jgi:hypothetical protein
MKFTLCEILNITDGRLVTNDKIDSVYKVIGHIIHSNVTTIGLWVYADQAKDHILSVYPEFANNRFKDGITAAINEWKDAGRPDGIEWFINKQFPNEAKINYEVKPLPR